MVRSERTTWRGVRLSWVGLSGVLALGIGSSAQQPAKPAIPDSAPTIGQGRLVKSADPLAEPLELAARAKKAYAKVRDYTCTLIKREMLDGKLSPNHVLAFKVRTSPFSVNMKWQEPKSLAGQEVCYIAGKKNGEMRVRAPGLLGALGFISLSPDDEQARKASKHRITDAGIGWLIDQCLTGWELERKLGKTIVRIGTYDYAKQRCTRIELTHPTRVGKKLLYYRNVFYFDHKTNLPIRVESYDWPKTPGQPADLVEVYSYVNLKLNTNLPDSVFER